MGKFQLIATIIIIGLVVVAVLVLSGVIPGLPGVSRVVTTDLTMWGVLPKNDVRGLIGEASQSSKKLVGAFNINYIEKTADVYESELVDALASGEGPDLFFLPQDMLLKHLNKVQIIPYSSFTERAFKDSLADVAEVYLLEEGVAAVPFAVDVIVMYWNKDLFNKAGLASPPRYWSEFINFSEVLTRNDSSGNILESGTALGEFSNIKNAKEIFSLLILQSGNKIIEPKSFELKFGERSGAIVDPAVSALTFYTSFSNPSKISYSWNRALPNSQEMFTSGRLAMYFGYASEIKDIQIKNPHLSFDVTTVPQVENRPIEATYGKLYAVAVSKMSSNVNSAVRASFAFLNEEGLKDFENTSLIPSVSRKLLAQGNSNPALSVFYKAALQARSWLEPDAEVASQIFRSMIESVTSGRKGVSSAISDANRLLSAELEKVIK
ncbi:extracellular solute-binding protein [Patescibacteria group bacterium]